MAKRQKRDSIQEQALERMDEKPRPKYHSVVEIPATDLVLGDVIAERVNPRTGKATATKKVTKLEKDVRGCRNIHVNSSDCYDRIGTVQIVTEFDTVLAEPLGLMHK